MKILLATYWMVPHVGGVWNYMCQLKTELEKLGHEVDLLGYGENNDYLYLVNKEIKIPRELTAPLAEVVLKTEPMPTFYQDPVVLYCERQCRMFEQGLQHLNLGQYDLIHTQDVFSTGCVARTKPSETVLVATLHGSVAHEMKHHVTKVNPLPTSPLACQYFDQIEYEGATLASITIVANKWLKNILVNEFHVPEDQLIIRHYGYDIDAFLGRNTPSHDIQPPKDKKLILYTGRLIELKGVHHLLESLAKLKKYRTDWECWIVGEGEKLESLKQQATSLKLDELVTFLGTRQDIPYLLSLADIYVLPSLLENQPLSVIEAQISGVPAIVTDTGGLPEIVEDNVTGLIYPAGNIKALTSHINSLLQDPNLRKKLGDTAKKWSLSHWSLSKNVNKIEEIYRKQLNQ